VEGGVGLLLGRRGLGLGRHGAPEIVEGALVMRAAGIGALLLLGQARARAPAVAVDALVHERMGAVEHALDGGDAVLLLAARNVGLGEAEIVEDASASVPSLNR